MGYLIPKLVKVLPAMLISVCVCSGGVSVCSVRAYECRFSASEHLNVCACVRMHVEIRG